MNILLDEYDDEDESVKWLEDDYFNCGCCSFCSCSDENPCKNCDCKCIIDSDNKIELNNILSDNQENGKTDKFNYKFINNYTINIIKENDTYFVRITFEFKNDNTNEKYLIDLDINRETYLKIADELF